MKIDTSGFPMMAKQEAEYIRDLINKEKLERCLEWGSGNSTVYFPNECKSITSWLSIEHDGHYIDYLNSRINKKTVILWEPENEWYYQCLERNVGMFDFILIDGLFRNECIKLAMNILATGGVALLHDSGRKDYQEAMKEFNHTKIFDGEKQTSDGFYAHRGLTLFRK